MTCKSVEKITPIQPGESRDISLKGCLIPPEKAGDHTLVVNVDGLEPKIQQLEVSESALPPELARLFAGLGMFFAMMAILAVGAEVVVDILRVLLGMKRKVTAMEAFNKLANQLPGEYR